jgi:hypothetical protein
VKKRYAKKELAEIESIVRTFLAYTSMPPKLRTKKNAREMIEQIKRIYICLHDYVIASKEAIARFTEDCECPACETGEEALGVIMERIDEQSRFATLLKPQQNEIHMAIGLATAISNDVKIFVVQTFKFIIAAHEALEQFEAGNLTKTTEDPKATTPASDKPN